MAIQYPPRWSEATPMATVHAREPGAMWTWGEGGGLWLFLSLALVCSAQPFIPAHIQGPTSKFRHIYVHLDTCTSYAQLHVHWLLVTWTFTHFQTLAVIKAVENILLFPAFKFGECVCFFLPMHNEHIDFFSLWIAQKRLHIVYSALVQSAFKCTAIMGFGNDFKGDEAH